MTFSLSLDRSARPARMGVVLGIAALVLMTYAMPILGLLASVCVPLVTHRCRRHLWPDASFRQSLVWSLLAWVGLWLPGLLGFLTTVFAGSVGDLGSGISTVWLVLPLCAPDSLNAVLLPALAASATCLVGLLSTVATRRGWLWVAAAWLAPWVHQLAFSQIHVDFFC